MQQRPGENTDYYQLIFSNRKSLDESLKSRIALAIHVIRFIPNENKMSPSVDLIFHDYFFKEVCSGFWDRRQV